MPLPDTLLSASLDDLDLQVVGGAMPADLHGEVYVSAPLTDPRLTYQLFGFGALVRISLESGTHGAAPGSYALRQRVLDTPVRRLHDAAPDRFTAGLLGFQTPWGAPNMANTAPLPMGDRLFATWDVGRPVEVDPVSLSFLGEVGHQRSWGGGSFGGHDALPQVFSSAHPVVDSERGCVWTVKLTPASGGLQPSVVRFEGHGTSVQTWPVDGATVVGSLHTVGQTRHWLVLADSGNFKADMNEILGGERSVTIDHTVPVYFVRKDDVDATPAGTPVRCARAEIGPTTGHYYPVWDDDDGVRVLFEHMDLMDLGYRLRADDVDITGTPLNPRHAGFYQMAMSPQTVSEWVFTPTAPHESCAATRIAHRTGHDAFNLQLSAQDWSIDGQSRPTHHHVVFQGFRAGALARRVIDLYRDRVDVAGLPSADQPSTLVSFGRGDLEITSRYAFASTGDLPTSPAFVPRRGGAPGGGDGWVVLPVLSDDGLRVEIFDAADVGRGPLATLAPARPQPFPFLLHSAWMPSATPAQDADRLRFADELGEAELGRLGDDDRGILLAVAAQLDEERGTA